MLLDIPEISQKILVDSDLATCINARLSGVFGFSDCDYAIHRLYQAHIHTLEWATRHNLVNAVKYLHAYHLYTDLDRDIEHAITVAAQLGYLSIIKVLFGIKDVVSPLSSSAFMLPGLRKKYIYLFISQYLTHEQKYMYIFIDVTSLLGILNCSFVDGLAFCSAIKNGHTHILHYFCKSQPAYTKVSSNVISNATNDAVKNGHLDTLRFLHENELWDPTEARIDRILHGFVRNMYSTTWISASEVITGAFYGGNSLKWSNCMLVNSLSYQAVLLEEAVEKGHVELVEFLLRGNVGWDREGITLDTAALTGHVQVVRVMMKNGINRVHDTTLAVVRKRSNRDAEMPEFENEEQKREWNEQELNWLMRTLGQDTKQNDLEMAACLREDKLDILRQCEDAKKWEGICDGLYDSDLLSDDGPENGGEDGWSDHDWFENEYSTASRKNDPYGGYQYLN